MRAKFSKGLKNEYKEEGIPFLKSNQRYYDMVQRCSNPNHSLYPHYGGRGIKVEMTSEQFMYWFLRFFKEFRAKNPGVRPSVSRKDYNKGYYADNMELTSVGDNTKELYSRRGNPSPRGTIMDDMACLTLHTFKGQARMLSNHYGVTFQAVRLIQRGINRKEIFKALS